VSFVRRFAVVRVVHRFRLAESFAFSR